LTHEMGHMFQQTVRGPFRLSDGSLTPPRKQVISDVEEQFYLRRTRGDAEVKANELGGPGYGDREFAREDEWFTWYVGHSNRKEMLTMGMETLFSASKGAHSPAYIWADIEHVQWILGVLGSL
jgi:hypothetical protein